MKNMLADPLVHDESNSLALLSYERHFAGIVLVRFTANQYIILTDQLYSKKKHSCPHGRLAYPAVTGHKRSVNGLTSV